MARLKLTEQEQLLLQRMTFSGGRAIATTADKEDELLKQYGITQKRLKSLCREKYLVRERQPDGSMDVVFGSKGKYYAQSNYTEKLVTSASVHHDRGLYQAVCGLSKTELDSAMSAREYYTEINQNVTKTDTPDLIFRSDSSDEYEAIEIVTRNYKGEEIDRKIEWSRRAGMSINVIDIDGNRGGYY